MEQKNEWKRQLTILLMSFLGGYMGLDRFYKGQVAWGVVKLITLGGFGVWYLVDLVIAAYDFGKIDREARKAAASRE
jgi:TM2 domain-containing membrane protein YozV